MVLFAECCRVGCGQSLSKPTKTLAGEDLRRIVECVGIVVLFIVLCLPLLSFESPSMIPVIDV